MKWSFRIAAHLFILTYIVLTIEAFAYTMSHRKIGIFPWPIARYFYAMMAPYQGYQRWNYDLVAEGETEDGAWVRVDLLPYYPTFSRGQRNVRQGLITTHWAADARGDDALVERRYGELASRLMMLEARKGSIYRAMHLSIDEWPASPDGFEALRQPAFTSRRTVGHAP